MYIRKSGWVKSLDYIVWDFVCLNITFWMAYLLRHGIHNLSMIKSYRTIWGLALISHFCIAFFSDFYSGITERGYFKEFKKVLTHNIVMITFLFAYMFAFQVGKLYSRLILISFFFLNIIVMYMGHITLRHIRKKMPAGLARSEKTLLISNRECAEKYVEEIVSGHDVSKEIVGICLDEGGLEDAQICDIPVVAYGKDIYEYACRNVVDSVYICMELSDVTRINSIAERFLDMGITVHIRLNMFIHGKENTYFERINGTNAMTVSAKTVSITEMTLKRMMDILAGIVGCIITGILYIFLAPAIKIADPKGPVFFSQERAGKNGRTFKIYKFRSMYSDAEARKAELMDDNKMDGLMFKIDADPRIIGSGPDGKRKGLGHFLRASSLDEFPNFWSILKGDMSLIGTRPPTMDEYEKYELHHKSRLATKPGLTGLWQVSGRSDFTDFEEIVKLDNEYIRNWSIGLDIKIILKTVWVVAMRKGSV